MNDTTNIQTTEDATKRRGEAPLASSDLLGCPFCGAEPRAWKPFGDTNYWCVQCRQNGCMSAEAGSHKSQAAANRKWNTRPIENAVRAAEPLLKHYERQLAASLSCDSRSHDQDRKPRRQLNAILDALRRPNAKVSEPPPKTP